MLVPIKNISIISAKMGIYFYNYNEKINVFVVLKRLQFVSA